MLITVPGKKELNNYDGRYCLRSLEKKFRALIVSKLKYLAEIILKNMSKL